VKTAPCRRNQARIAIFIALFTLMITLTSVRAIADDAMEASHLVEKARLTFQNFMTVDEMEGFRDLMKSARGVFITPQILKAAFIFGASGGSGVFLAYDSTTGRWSDPAFYTMGEVSFGLQIGGQSSEIILLAMTTRGISAFMSTSLKLGADASIAAGPVGMGAEAATANLSADILSFSRNKGIYGGISLEGAVIATRNSMNQAFYGKPITPTDILILHSVSNPQTAELVNAVTQASLAR
jgi:SH3 domain-containing YSC84-like protein 1